MSIYDIYIYIHIIDAARTYMHAYIPTYLPTYLPTYNIYIHLFGWFPPSDDANKPLIQANFPYPTLQVRPSSIRLRPRWRSYAWRRKLAWHWSIDMDMAGACYMNPCRCARVWSGWTPRDETKNMKTWRGVIDVAMLYAGWIIVTTCDDVRGNLVDAFFKIALFRVKYVQSQPDDCWALACSVGDTFGRLLNPLQPYENHPVLWVQFQGDGLYHFPTAFHIKKSEWSFASLSLQAWRFRIEAKNISVTSRNNFNIYGLLMYLKRVFFEYHPKSGWTW